MTREVSDPSVSGRPGETFTFHERDLLSLSRFHSRTSFHPSPDATEESRERSLPGRSEEGLPLR